MRNTSCPLYISKTLWRIFSKLCTKITLIRPCAERMTEPWWLKVKVFNEGHQFACNTFLSIPYFENPLKNFHGTLHKWSSQLGGIHNSWLNHADSTMWLKFKITIEGDQFGCYNFLSTPYLQNPMKNFHKTLHEWSPQSIDGQNLWLDHADSQWLKVKALIKS